MEHTCGRGLLPPSPSAQLPCISCMHLACKCFDLGSAELASRFGAHWAASPELAPPVSADCPSLSAGHLPNCPSKLSQAQSIISTDPRLHPPRAPHPLPVVVACAQQDANRHHVQEGVCRRLSLPRLCPCPSSRAPADRNPANPPPLPAPADSLPRPSLSSSPRCSARCASRC